MDDMDDLAAVTNAELWRTLIRMEAKLDHIADDHEQRIRKMERYAYTSVGLACTGAVSGLSALLGALGG